MLEIDGQRVVPSVQPRRDGVRYTLRLPVPSLAAPVVVRIDLHTRAGAWSPAVVAGVPECLRHRYSNGALCLWWQQDPAALRWTFADGIPALVHHVRRHLYQEACCRAGEAWPGEEAPGDHPRPPACRTCGGDGP